jgi:hypothetical protein
MSGIRAARDLSPESAPMLRAPSTPSAASAPGEARQIQVMQDLLYDILATGVDSERTDVSVEMIESFLHEHARVPKSAAEFRSFFAQHGLTSRMPAPVLPAVAPLPPLKRVANAQRPSSVPPALPVTAHEAPPFEEAFHPVRFDLAPQPVERRRSRPLIGLLVATTTLVIAAALYAGSLHLMEMRADLARSEEQAAQNRVLIESLRAQTITFESSLAASGQLIERMEQKSDLVLDSLQRAEQEKQKKKRW